MITIRALLLAGLLACASPVVADKPVAPVDIPGAVNVTAEKLVELVTRTPQLVVIDSRRQEEFDKGHIEGAANLLDTDMTRARLARLVPGVETPVLFYCNGERCLRSSNAASLALEWGYRKVYWFRGGWAEWSDKKLPVAK